MRKYDQNLIKTFLLALLIASGGGFASAAWNSPSANPPLGNTPAPINTTTTDQVKQGGLRLGTGTCPGADGVLEVCGSFKTSGIASEGNFIIQSVDEPSALDIGFVTDSDYTNTNSNLILNGSLRNGPSLSATNSVDIDGTAKIEKFASVNTPPDTVYPARLCANTEGVFDLCQNLFTASTTSSSVSASADGCYQDHTLVASPGSAGTPTYTYSWSFDPGVDNIGNEFVSATNQPTVVVRAPRDESTGSPGLWTMGVKVTITDGDGYVDVDSYSTQGAFIVNYDSICI